MKIKKGIVALIASVLVLSILNFKPFSTSAATTFIMPAEGRLSSEYGVRNGTMHFGIDIANSVDVPIKASASGKVVRSYNSTSYGEAVILEHNIGGKVYQTVYAHMESGSRKVSAGQTVTQGQTLGIMGNTGQSFGQHLHFELHVGAWNGAKSNAVNPLNYLGKDIGGVETADGTYRLLSGVFATEAAQQAAAEKVRAATGWTIYTVNENGLRLKTGVFSTESAVKAAQTKLSQQFGYISYIKQEYYRLVTGTFGTEADQQAAYARLKEGTGMVLYKINEDGLRLKTGTFSLRSHAENAQHTLKDEYGYISYITVETVTK